MRGFLFILMFLAEGLNGLAANRITTAQLQSFVLTSSGKSDTKVADEIYGLELTERLSSAQLTLLTSALPGNRSKLALQVLADTSAFLDPPQSEMPPIASPDPASQHEMTARMVNYVNQGLNELPDLFATRFTLTFRRETQSEKPMQSVGSHKQMEIYRHGLARFRASKSPSTPGHTTTGEFGPILNTAILDAAQGSLTWSHWEQADQRTLGVFRYSVGAKESHYVVQNQRCAYEGEIAIDPSSGAIFRVVFRSDPDLANPLPVANMVVEYGYVELGGKRYICPLKGIALSEDFQQIWLNDVAFEKYHLPGPNSDGGPLKGLAASVITIEQLKRLVLAAHDESDAEAASELEGLELTERLSSAQFTLLLADLPGNRSRDALLVLADMSAFFGPPPSEIPSIETPDFASQHQMVALTVNYVNNTLYALPNFYATRITKTFRRELWSDKPLHPVGRYSDIQLYRDGRLQASRPQSRSAGLTTSGEFGPILGTAILDAARGKLTWSHWEKGSSGPLAVYRYAVSAKESHYVVQDKVSGYRGEITIDPSTGAILRIVLTTDADQGAPIPVANLVVEYGLVELGGKTYVCPLKGTAYSEDSQLAWLNDVVFDDYHLFRSDMRILPGLDEVH